MAKHIQIVEVSPRDGLQADPADLTTDQKVALIERLIAGGHTRIEAASFVDPKAVPKMADGDAVMAKVPRIDGVSYSALAFNTRGVERAVAAEIDEGNTTQVSAAALCQLYLVCASLLTVPLAIVLADRNRLVAQVTAEEVLFRRNFTDSLLGQLILRIDHGVLRVVDANDTAAEVVRRPAGSLVGTPLEDLLATPAELGVRLVSGQSWRGRVSLRDDDASRVEVALSRLSHIGDGGSPVWSAQLLDVSAEHVARQGLEAAERLTSATLDTTAAVILVTDREGRIVRANQATTDLTGWREEDLLGRKGSETTLAASATPDLEALFVWPNRSGQPVVREGEATTRDGKKLRILWSNNMVRDEQDLPAYAVLTGIDVTTERASSGLVSHLMRAAITTAIIGVDQDGLITVFNAGAELMLDQDATRQIGHRFVDLLDPDHGSVVTISISTNNSYLKF